MKKQRLASASVCAVIGSLYAASLLAEAPGSLYPCRDDNLGERAECGRLIVPENPAQPKGRFIDLNIVVLRAESPSAREPVFMLAGGPGQAATKLASLALRPFAEVNKTRDFVLVDHRGTGGSNPIDCPVDSATDPTLAFGGLFDPSEIAECLDDAGRHADVTLYTSRYAVRDLEAVRKWLGYGQILLWGGSGGTRTGLVYLREFPSSVAGALFDGIAPTNFRAPSGFAPAAQRALDRVFEDCRLQESCRDAYPELDNDLGRLFELFASGPVKTRVTTDNGPVEVEMHQTDLAYTIRGLLYSSRRIPQIPLMIHNAARSADVSAFAQAHWQRDAAVRPSIAVGLHMAIYCAEDLPFIDYQAIDEMTRKSFLGHYLLDQYGNACKAWRSNPEPASFTEPVRADVPVLLFSGYYDPSTPDGLADETTGHLANARHIVARNEGHGAQFGCARPLAIDFLNRGTLDGLGPACEGVGPIEFEVPETQSSQAGS